MSITASSVHFAPVKPKRVEFSGADPENTERGGGVSHRPEPPHPTPHHERKLQFSGHAAYSIVGVFVMQSQVTFTFRKVELKSIL